MKHKNLYTVIKGSLKILLWLIVLVFFSNCTPKPKMEAFERMVSKSEYTVVMFFAPDCPLCKTFSKPFNELQENYPKVQFIAVQSGMHYEPMEIKMFKEETDLKAKIFMDYEYDVAHKLNASVTPEFFVLDQHMHIMYQGLLDNRMKGLGVYKQHWDEFYLRSALDKVRDGKRPKTRHTKAIGCDLEY